MRRSALLVYVEYISRRPGVSVEAFHFAAGRGQHGWSSEHSEDVLLLNLGRTFRTGPEPEYVAVWYSRKAGLERIGEWERIFASGEADHLEETFRLAARIDTAGSYEPLLEPVEGRDGLYYGEYLDFAPGVGRDEVAAFFSQRPRPAQEPDAQPPLRPHRRARAGPTLPGCVDRAWLGCARRRRARPRRCGRAGPTRPRRPVPGPRLRNPVTVPPGVGIMARATFCPPTSRCWTDWCRAASLARGPSALAGRRRGPSFSDAAPGRSSPPTCGRSWRQTSTWSWSSRRPHLTPSSRDLRWSTASTSSWRSPSRRAARKAKRSPASPRSETCICSRRRSSSCLPRPRVLDDRRRRRAGTRPLRAGALRQCRLALDDVVPLGRTRPAR